MIKKSTLTPIAVAIPCLIIAMVFFFSATPDKKNKNMNEVSRFNNAIEFSGLTKNTNIETTYLDNRKLVAENIIIGDQGKARINLNKTSILGFRISKDNNIYDINTRIDANKIIISASGFAPETTIRLQTDDPLFSKPTPVDWAGRITLNKNLSGNNFCIHIKNKNDLSICHQTEEVTS